MLSEIRQILASKSDAKAKPPFKNSFPHRKISMGFVPILNELATHFKSGGFDLVEELWKSGAFEEKLLATKIWAKYARRIPIEH